jgi:hypothetical protein
MVMVRCTCGLWRGRGRGEVGWWGRMQIDMVFGKSSMEWDGMRCAAVTCSGRR